MCPQPLFRMETTLHHAVKTLLSGLELCKYIPIFEKNMITMPLFMSLTEEDLITIGIADRNDIDLILKYIRKFQNADTIRAIEPLRQKEVQQGLKNMADQLYIIDVGTSYVYSMIIEENPVDFMIDKVSLSSGIEVLCSQIENECSKFITEVDKLIQMHDTPSRKNPYSKIRNVGISLSVVTSVILLAFILRFRNVN